MHVNMHCRAVDGVALKPLPLWLVTLDIRQAPDAMPLKTPMERRPRQMRKRRECHELCVSDPAHAGFRYDHALKRSSNMIAN